MFFERLRLAARTLRFRLMVWNAGVVLLTAIVTLVGVREGVRRAILHEMDQILIEDAQEIGMAASELVPTVTPDIREEIDRKARGHVQHGWFARLLDDRGNEVWKTADAPHLALDSQVIRDGTPFTKEGLRLVQIRIPNEDGRQFSLRVGTSLNFLERDMSRIDRLVAIAVGVVFFVAPLLGYWLAGRTTQTLRELIGATARLRPTRLDERLPIRNTGDELDQLSRTVNGLLDRIADYLAQRHDFLANSAHELRTPVAAIRSTAEVALGANRTKEEYEELLAEVIDECQALEVLVNQLLLLAETESDRLRIHGERVPLDSVVRDSVDMFRAVAESRDIKLVLERCQSAIVEGNRHHLRQVINNLLDNAIKFTGSGGSVRVSLAVEQPARRVILRVSDTGFGISPDDVPHVFERFFRCDRARTHSLEFRGTGLGLSIVQAVVVAHGGQISVESVVNAGTTFVVALPATTPGSSPAALEKTPKATTLGIATSSAEERDVILRNEK